jgi:hypothetical protein
MTLQIHDQFETRTHRPTPQVQVLIEDVAAGICHVTYCELPSGLCNHKKVATDVVKATIDHFIDVFEKMGNTDVSNILRGQM